MSGKKKISYPIELPFIVGNPVYYNSAEDKCKLHNDVIVKILYALNGSFHVGYVKRDRKGLEHGINAHSLNDAIREKLKSVPEIEGETSVVFGSFLPSVYAKGEFDFSVFDKSSNFYSLWNYLYGKTGAVRNGDELVDCYIRDDKTKTEWNFFLESRKPRKYEEDLVAPSDAFNLLGEIQFGNWAMVYKDMFRLVSAINKKAKIDLYIYIAASGTLKKLMSDGIVGFEDACKRFEENVDNHNINRPVMILPLDLDLDITSYDFSEAMAGYDGICSIIEALEKNIGKKKVSIKKLREEKKTVKGEEVRQIQDKINNAQIAKREMEKELKELKNKYKEYDEFDKE